MGLLNIIRRMALRDELPIREVSRRTGLSRNTIKKYLNAGTVEPKFATPARPSKLGPFAEKLSAWLKIGSRQIPQAAPDAEAASCRSGGSRLHRFLQSGRRLCPVLAHGSPAGAADDGARHLRPLAFRAGEAFQFDWSEDYAVLGERTKLQIAHIKLSHSRAFLLRAYLLQTREMLFDAHWHGFRVFGGVPGAASMTTCAPRSIASVAARSAGSTSGSSP
jgi:transposase